MNSEQGVNRCLSFIHCELESAPRAPLGFPAPVRHAITISRQTGSGAHTVADELLNYLKLHSPATERPWTIFDRNLVQQVLLEHNLPAQFARFMPEDRVREFEDTMEELFGLHPPTASLVRKTSETIRHLAQLGNVIIIGRAANLITARLPHVLNVRLVAPLPKRLAYVQKERNLSPKEALQFIRTEDCGRERYLKKYFHKNVDDPLLYHLTINTDSIPFPEVASIIGEASLAKSGHQSPAGVSPAAKIS
jgi:cytidylate kinase